MRGVVASLALVILALSGCATPAGGSSTAVWVLAPGEAVSAESASIDVLVSRLGCNSGVTGAVNQPVVEATDDEIVITFTVSPEDAEFADCQGNDQVEYVIELDDPVGDRALVDGACRTTSASSTVFCDSEYR